MVVQLDPSAEQVDLLPTFPHARLLCRQDGSQPVQCARARHSVLGVPRSTAKRPRQGPSEGKSPVCTHGRDIADCAGAYGPARRLARERAKDQSLGLEEQLDSSLSFRHYHPGQGGAFGSIDGEGQLSDWTRATKSSSCTNRTPFTSIQARYSMKGRRSELSESSRW